MVALFAVTTLMGSGLLSVVEPMVAKMLLPSYGGSPMVWNTSVLFFQIALLAGCAYAHVSERLLGARWQSLVQIPLVVAPVFLLPIALPTWSGARGSGPTALWLLLELAVAVGVPLAVISTIGPLVQRWYSCSDLPRSRDPYYLFAVGSVGSVVALLAYPILVEPVADLATQTRWWAVGYGVFTALVVACGLIVRFRVPKVPVAAAADAATTLAEQISWRRRARWLGLAFVPSSLMLSVTTHISTTITAVRLIWVVPLALYLATFVVAFGVKKQRWVSPAATVTAISAVALPWSIHLMGRSALANGMLLSLLLVAGLACHGHLAQIRPTPRRLTEFFLIMSLGAALGGMFNSLVAPLIFSWDVELPLVMTGLAVLPLTLGRPEASTLWRFPGAGALVKAFVLTGPLFVVATYLNLGGYWCVMGAGLGCLPWCALVLRRPRMMAIAAALTTAVLVWHQTSADSFRERTFFGDYQIYADNGWWVLAEDGITRGYQYPSGPEHTTPVSYYGRPGPFGDLFAVYGAHSSRIAVVGLGTGVVASYGRRGQHMDFYEIDPAVPEIAVSRFSYLNDSEADTTVIVGDGRLRLDKVSDGSYGMIVLDEFSFGAVPTHLLTREALRTYARKLAPGGVLAFHVTTGNLDLAPMLEATARAAGLTSMTGHGDADVNRLYQAATWVAVARADADLRPLRATANRWHAAPPDGPVWTDARTSLSGMLKLR
jgi:SAM-dependent methyltransferase